MFSIRPPLPPESSVVADLVLQSDCGMLTSLFGANVQALIARLQSAAGNPYSSRNTLVAAEEAAAPPGAPGTVAGALVGARADATRRDNLRTAGLLAGWFGPGVVARLPRLARAGRALAGLAPDDFYLSHIAVMPTRQGHGFGKALLEACEDRARQAGARRVVLDVEINNEQARGFYHRMSYMTVGDVRVDLGSGSVFAFLRLAKDLAVRPQAARAD